MDHRHRWATAAAALSLSAVLTGCGQDDVGTAGPANDVTVDVGSEFGEVTLVSDDSQATVPPVCVEDIPEDLTTCPGAPANLGQVELDQTRKATLQLPTELVESGYRLRLNGSPLPGLEDVLTDAVEPFRVPVEEVQVPGPTVVTVEALSGTTTPKAVWQFLLSDPASAPS